MAASSRTLAIATATSFRRPATRPPSASMNSGAPLKRSRGSRRPELERQAQEALAKVEVDPSALLSEFDLSPADRAVLEDPRVQQRLRTTTRESFANGVSGWVDDDLAFTVPWGFDVSELEVPVEIRYGATDVLVPAAHGEWLTAHIPQATVIVDETGGHLSSPDDGLKELGELVAG